jgi:hypothetical protein
MTNFKRQRSDKEEIIYVLHSESEATEEDSEQIHEEEYDVTEQAPVLYRQGLCKRGQPMGHNNTNESCNCEFIQTLTPRSVKVGTADE